MLSNQNQNFLPKDYSSIKPRNPIFNNFERILVTQSANISITAANIACFIIFQCIFFYFVASTQLDRLVLDKGSTLSTFTKTSPVLKHLLCSKLRDQLKVPEETLKTRQKERNKQNIKSLVNVASPFVIPFTIVSIATAITSIRNGLWTKVHNVSMIFVVLCFTTELLIFLAVFQTHEIIGEWEVTKLVADLRQKKIDDFKKEQERKRQSNDL